MHWQKEFKKGQKFLEDQDLQKALKCFETAVSNCPVSAGKSLEKTLYFLGLTLEKLGRYESALRCWYMGKKINSEGSSLRMIVKYSNSYGLVNSEKNGEDDRKAFISLQLERYLLTKRNRRFCSVAERDVIMDIINSYWSEMQISGEIDQMTTDEKLSYFRSRQVIFPVADINSVRYASRNDVLNFQSMDEPCSCGSGLLYGQCCGRIRSAEELSFGEI